MDCKKILEVQKQIVPEIIETINSRYDILRTIEVNQPIGRRTLANKLNKTEKIVRTEVEKLKEMELIDIISSGMILTDLGKDLLIDLDELMHDLKNLSSLEKALENILGIREVIIVSGNTSKDEHGFANLGKKSANIISDKIKDNYIVGIAGGTTMALVASQMKKKSNLKNITIVPARGALNEEIRLQANTVAFNLAQKFNANYKMLHIPDDLNESELHAIKENESIRDVLESINNVNLLIFGLGDAYDMAIRRKADFETLKAIKEEKLVAETFGYFFDNSGEVKLQMNSVGITIDNIKKVEHSVAVAVGEEKAKVITAFSNFYKNFTLVTDEITANKILELNEKAEDLK